MATDRDEPRFAGQTKKCLSAVAEGSAAGESEDVWDVSDAGEAAAAGRPAGVGEVHRGHPEAVAEETRRDRGAVAPRRGWPGKALQGMRRGSEG